MSAYGGLQTMSVQSLTTCFAAATADASYTAALFVLARSMLKDPEWHCHLTAARVRIVALVGAITAVVTEKVALRAGLWTYNTSMYTLPLLHVGILPILQLMFLPIATFYTVGRFFKSICKR
jgi:hypothetical protein